MAVWSKAARTAMLAMIVNDSINGNAHFTNQQVH